MRKVAVPLDREISPKRRRSKVLQLAVVVVLGLLLAIPGVEGAAVCIGKWREVLGTNTEVRTPILDSISAELQAAHDSMSNWIHPHFQRLPWNPSYVLPIAAVVTVLGMGMLKR